MEIVNLLTLGNALVYIYTGAFFYCLLNRGFDSASLVLVTLVPIEFFMRDIRDPLIGFVTIHYQYAYYIWFPFWMLCELLILIVLYIIHRDMKLRSTKLYLMVANSIFILAVIQFLGLIDSLTIKSSYFTLFYTYSIPSLNVGIFIYSIYFVFRYGNNNKDSGYIG